MNPRIATDLTAGLLDLTTLGAMLVRDFNSATFPTCSRLARAIRATLSPAHICKSLEDDAIPHADAMLRDVRALHDAVTVLACIPTELTARISGIADALLAYRASLEPAAEAEELLAA